VRPGREGEEEIAALMVRPSGTEPKVKYYFERSEAPAPGEPIASARSRAEEKLREMEAAFKP
jgi:phosphomannomutase